MSEQVQAMLCKNCGAELEVPGPKVGNCSKCGSMVHKGCPPCPNADCANQDV